MHTPLLVSTCDRFSTRVFPLRCVYQFDTHAVIDLSQNAIDEVSALVRFCDNAICLMHLVSKHYSARPLIDASPHRCILHHIEVPIVP